MQTEDSDPRFEARRRFLLGSAALGASLTLDQGAFADRLRSPARSSLTFEELSARLDHEHAVAPGHTAQILIRWGDPVLAGAPEFEPATATAQTQSMQFGEGSDHVAYFPLPLGSNSSNHGLLAINHEQCHRSMMLPGERANENFGEAEARVELAAHGLSVIEVRLEGDQWIVVPNSPFARRITGETPVRLTGPAAGSPRLVTRDDPRGRTVLGTLNNCGGGWTPWGTLLTCEENIDEYFGGDFEQLEEPERSNAARFGMGRPAHRWGESIDRFNVNAEPNEFNRFGWVVEIDPYAPTSKPRKRTALGRLRHESATCALTPDGRVVVYTGDDTKGEYLYRFVSEGKFDPKARSANTDLLDRGVLSVARLDEDGSLHWLPLVHGKGPLTPENGFASQADISIETRRAGDLLGATPLDRPEDVEASPVTGRVYAALTKNSNRGTEAGDPVDAANPRAGNRDGHVPELLPPGEDGARDHGAETYRWEVFLLAGDPNEDSTGSSLHPDTTEHGWFSCPDNLAFDPKGRLWIATDGNPWRNRRADGLFACDTGGEGRALTRAFYAGPLGSELCGPCFTPDGSTLFASVQHPGLIQGSTFEKPLHRWPDANSSLPPRSSVVALRREDGGPIT